MVSVLYGTIIYYVVLYGILEVLTYDYPQIMLSTLHQPAGCNTRRVIACYNML
jgi:hypothetical protein